MENVEIINVHFYVQSAFAENCVVTGERVDRYGRVGQVTDDNIRRRMSVAYSITKVTDTLTYSMEQSPS